MPSTLLGIVSGDAQPLISGNHWSGRQGFVGGIQLKLAGNASGNAYVGLSGGITLSSGNVFLSGGGLLDGVEIRPGESYFIPRIAFPTSGEVNVYMRHDAAASGQARMFWETF